MMCPSDLELCDKRVGDRAFNPTLCYEAAKPTQHLHKGWGTLGCGEGQRRGNSWATRSRNFGLGQLQFCRRLPSWYCSRAVSNGVDANASKSTAWATETHRAFAGDL